MPSSDFQRIAIMGKLAAGKGTQSRLLASRLSLTKISTGEMLRSIRGRGSLGHDDDEVKGINSGELAPEELVRNLVKSALLCTLSRRQGFVLDGFPRTMDQITYLEEVFPDQPLTTVVYINVSDDTALDRLKQRISCESCGQSSRDRSQDSSRSHVCSYCGGRLSVRPDDSIGAAARRLSLHQSITKPVADFYRKRGILCEVDGSGDPSTVFQKLLGVIEGSQHKQR